MRTFALLFIGVVVGWAVSGVDWSRDVLAQDALIDAPPSTLRQDVPDAPPQPTYRAAPVESRKADGIFQEGSNPRQRSVSYDHIKPAETSTGGQPYSSPPTDVVERRVTDGNGRTMAILENRNQQHSTTSGLVGRFQATAYGSPSGHGCYVVDTMTGKTWHAANGQQARVVTEALVQSAAQPTTPAYYAPPLTNRPEPELTEPTPDRRTVESPAINRPVPQVAEPDDAN